MRSRAEARRVEARNREAEYASKIISLRCCALLALEACFGLLTPLPATPLYKRLEAAGRLTRPKHWQEFIPFEMAHTPLKMTMAQAHAEVKYGWARSYSPEALAKAVNSLRHKPLGYRINIFIARVCFRGIYFPQMGLLAWVKLISQNRHTIFNLVREAFAAWRSRPISTASN